MACLLNSLLIFPESMANTLVNASVDYLVSELYICFMYKQHTEYIVIVIVLPHAVGEL